MSELYYNSGHLTRYLLGDLPQTEQDQLEEDYFSNDELFIELLDVKDQLISDYLGGQMAPADRDRFERRFLAQPDCRLEVELGSFLQFSSTRNSLFQQITPREEARPWWQGIFSALRANLPLTGAAVAALLIIGFIGLRSVLISSLEEDQSKIGQVVPQSSVGMVTETLSIKPGRLRSQGVVPTARVVANTQSVELQLEVGAENYTLFQAILLRVDEGDIEVLKDSALKAGQTPGKPRLVTWKVPASKLPIGDYQIKLSGIGAGESPGYIGEYHFMVRDK